MAVTVKRRNQESDIFAPFTAEALARFLEQAGSDLLEPWRRGSFARAMAAPTPTNRDEDFKYVNFGLLDLAGLAPRYLNTVVGSTSAATILQSDGTVSTDSHPDSGTSDRGYPQDSGDIFFGSFDDAAHMLPEQLATYLELINKRFPARKFAHLAQAFLSQGVFLHGSRNGLFHEPRQIISRLSDSNAITSLAGLVVMEESAQATALWDIESTEGVTGLQNGTLDIILRGGSKLSLMLNQHHAAQFSSVMTVRAYLERDSELELVTLNSGGRLNQMEIDLQFAGEGSRATVSGVYVGRNTENFNLLTHQDHRVGNCRSDLFYIGTLSGTSKSNYLGKITIAPKAQRSDAYQKNRNLVLNKGVSVNSSPKLEIGANDVRCSHGATISRVSDLEMFYLRSRGIDKNTAKVLLADGFLSQVSERLQSATVKQAYEQRLSRLLSNWG